MEMHQVRYFLAVARTLNFTRAADECNVAQPSLTRAIKLLEAELGGDLFRRERPQAMLTPLGERMHPLLKQCYDSAQNARALAEMINDGGGGALKLAVSSSIELGLILPHIAELRKHFNDVELKILRGGADKIVEFMKSGEAELAIGAPVGDAWDRLDCWPLFEETFDLVFSRMHRLANHERIEPQDLESERYLVRAHCERCEEMTALLRGSGLDLDNRHEVWSDQDFLTLVDANMGLGFLPRTVRTPPTVARAAVGGVTLKRAICLYGVAGRQRTPIAGTFMKMLRAANWSTPGQ